MLFKKRANSFFLADQNNRNVVLGCRLDGAVDFNSRRIIAAHGVDCDFEAGHQRLFLGCLDDFSVFVVAAMRTCAMRHAQFMTVGALGKGSCAQMIMCTTTIAPRLRMTSFWI